MTLTPQEQQELKALEEAIASHLSQLRKPAKVERVSDAQGDRLLINDNGDRFELPIFSNQNSTNTKIS